MRRPSRALLLTLIFLATVAGQPGMTAAADPSSSADDGSVALPNGRVLPPAPPGAEGMSEMARALQQHEHDHISFTPGARPKPRVADAADATASLALAESGGSATAELIALAPSDPEGAQATLASLPNGLRKQVFGFLPYWMLSASDLQWMRYDLVSTIAYFGVAARSDGSFATTSTGWSGWNSSSMTNVINAAHARGDRVVLTVTMMAWDSASANAQATLLKSSTYRTRLVNNIVATVRNRNADGVNLDFEPLSTTLRSYYTAFVRQLKAALAAAGSRYSYLTVCTTAGAATWATGYDVTALTASGASDGIFVMGYDYSWSGSSRAGGVAPMESSYMLDVNQSVGDFLSLTTGSKLIWGVPYYGRTWHTTSTALNATTVSGASGYSKAYYYTGAKALAAAHGGRRWDPVGLVPWFAYYDSTAHSYVEGYYDDPSSLSVKYDMINRRGLAGVGMWHLLMDEGVSDLWNVIANKFQRDTMPPSGGISLMPSVTDAYAIPVRWRAIDVGVGLANYTVQVRDRASTTWYTWKSLVTYTSATYLGTPGHAYEFRVAAKDKLGNIQPWQPAQADPGTSLKVGGFASVSSSLLNVRSGAGTSFTQLDQLTTGERVALRSGPVSASGYQWYQVQFDFAEWPSATYPRIGWVAAGDGTGAFIVPTTAPNVTKLQPWITAYAPKARVFSPNGDSRFDTVAVGYTLPAATTAVRLDVLNASGSVVDTLALGAQAAGAHQATWDGRLPSGAWAPGGSYLLRVTATIGGTNHSAPTTGVDATILGRWGTLADVTRPSVVATTPTASPVTGDVVPSARFSEAVTGVSTATLTLTDTTTGNAVAGSVTYDAASRTAAFHPASRLPDGHGFRATLSSGVSDVVGNPLVAKTWGFSTPAPVTVFNPVRTLRFLAGTTVGYRFDSTGKVIASKSFTLTSPSSASTSKRSEAIPGHGGAWFAVTNGIWAGYWVGESPRVYLPGFVDLTFYATRRMLAFSAGTYTGYRFSSAGSVLATKRYTLASSSSASADRQAVVNGRTYAYIVNGVWAGYWMPVGGGVTLR